VVRLTEDKTLISIIQEENIIDSKNNLLKYYRGFYEK